MIIPLLDAIGQDESAATVEEKASKSPDFHCLSAISSNIRFLQDIEGAHSSSSNCNTTNSADGVGGNIDGNFGSPAAVNYGDQFGYTISEVNLGDEAASYLIASSMTTWSDARLLQTSDLPAPTSLVTPTSAAAPVLSRRKR